MYAVTGATGQLGRLVLEALLVSVAPDQIVALVRDPAKLADLAQRGVVVRAFDYARAETLTPALAGVERLLLISSSEVGQREAQHRAVIEAAKAAGRSEEHTSELQSLMRISYAVFCLRKKNYNDTIINDITET